VVNSADIPANFAELVDAMGDEERARVVVEQNPNVVLRFKNTKIKFAQLADICGSNEYARALVEKSSTVLRSPRLKENFSNWAEIFGDRQVALALLKRVPSLLDIAHPKKKFDEFVLLKGGSAQARAEDLGELSRKPLLLRNMTALRKSLSASSE
jgi:hypothetical protein